MEKLSLISVVKEALKTKFRDLLQILEEKEKEDAEMWFNKDSDSETISTSSDQEHSVERSESSSDSQLQDLPRWQAAGFGDSARRSDSHRKQQAKFLREQKHQKQKLITEKEAQAIFQIRKQEILQKDKQKRWFQQEKPFDQKQTKQYERSMKGVSG